MKEPAFIGHQVLSWPHRVLRLAFSFIPNSKNSVMSKFCRMDHWVSEGKSNLPQGSCLSLAVPESDQNYTTPDHFLCLQCNASFGKEGGVGRGLIFQFENVELVGWGCGWRRERLFPELLKERWLCPLWDLCSHSSPPPLLPSSPSPLLCSLPLWKRCPGLRGYVPSWIFNKDDK